MPEVFRLSGDFYAGEPILTTTAALQVGEAVSGQLGAVANLKRKLSAAYDLAADAPVAVDFGGLAAAHVLVLRTVGGAVSARLTHAGGGAQVVPVDALLVLVALASPLTAIDLVRSPGVRTEARVFLGEKL